MESDDEGLEDNFVANHNPLDIDSEQQSALVGGCMHKWLQKIGKNMPNKNNSHFYFYAANLTPTWNWV